MTLATELEQLKAENARLREELSDSRARLTSDEEVIRHLRAQLAELESVRRTPFALEMGIDVLDRDQVQQEWGQRAWSIYEVGALVGKTEE